MLRKQKVSHNNYTFYWQGYVYCICIYVGCPTVIRLDRGTENVKMAAVQYAFRENHLDELSGEKSFRFGTSPANIVNILCCIYVIIIISMFLKRIESWWSQLRRHKTGWWIHVFKVYSAYNVQEIIMYHLIKEMEQLGLFDRVYDTHRYYNYSCVHSNLS